jgi:hypothetical protein
MSVNEEFTGQLLVEGNDDQHVIWALCVKFNLRQNFEVIDCKGIEKLHEQIPVRFKQSGINTIGIIVDADTNLQNRWSRLRDLLIAQDFTMPDELPSKGLILTNSQGKRIGVWIMPNNNLNGMLEDFISFLVPKDDKLLPIVNATLQNLEDNKLNKYSLAHKSKAAIHSWLSWQEDPGTPMGLGITKRYLTTDEETCLQLTNWLTSLFN